MGFADLLIKVECVNRPIVIAGAILVFRHELRKQCRVIRDTGKDGIGAEMFADLVSVAFIESELSCSFAREIELPLQRKDQVLNNPILRS